MISPDHDSGHGARVSASLSQPPADHHAEHLQVEVGSQQFLVPLAQVNEVIHLASVTVVMDAPHYVSGFLDRHGDTLSIVDLRSALGWPARFSQKTVIVVVTLTIEGWEGSQVGLIVDRLLNWLPPGGPGDPRRAKRAASVPLLAIDRLFKVHPLAQHTADHGSPASRPLSS